MTCPSCREAVPAGSERCPACGGPFVPPVEGALAPDPARSRVEPLREIPGLRKKERTWKDEVRERVRDRKRDRSGDRELPLFRDAEEAVAELETVPGAPPDLARPEKETDPESAQREEEDLPLRPREVAAGPAPSADLRGDLLEEPPEQWSLRPAASADVAERPVERPARPGERMQAALLDLALLAALWTLVLYFASRAAHVSLIGLLPAWPYLVAYLAFLGLTYAAHFTGATGQTLGKVAAGLQVVDASGRPPGYVRAFARAFLGSAGVLLAGSGLLPMLVDPARRGFHDRLLKTRVIKR